MAGADEEDVRGSLQEALHEALQAAASCMDRCQHSLDMPEALTNSPPMQHGPQWSPDGALGSASREAGWGLQQQPSQSSRPASPGPVATMIQSLLQCQARVEVVFMGSRAHNVQLEGNSPFMASSSQLVRCSACGCILVRIAHCEHVDDSPN